VSSHRPFATTKNSLPSDTRHFAHQASDALGSVRLVVVLSRIDGQIFVSQVPRRILAPSSSGKARNSPTGSFYIGAESDHSHRKRNEKKTETKNEKRKAKSKKKGGERGECHFIFCSQPKPTYWIRQFPFLIIILMPFLDGQSPNGCMRAVLRRIL